MMGDFEEIVKDSCSMLAQADSDIDKMAALLHATPCIQSEHNDPKSLAMLFRAIGPLFLCKMLSGRLDVPIDNEAVDVYRSTALNIIVSFSVSPEIAKDKELLKMTPYVFELLRSTKDADNVLVSAIQFFKCIVQHEEGRQALLSHDALKHFAWMYSQSKSEDTLDLISALTRNGVPKKYSSSFNFLMTSLAEEFASNQTKKKFTICDHLLQILSLNRNGDLASTDQKWPKSVLKGLRDVLTSRIDDKQRVPALKLAAVMIDSYGMGWAVEETQQPIQRQFQLILVHLSSIECRMQMEDQPISSVLKNADLIIACFNILEKAVQDLLGENIDMREKDQIVQSYSDAAAAVMSTLSAISAFEGTIQQHKIFIYAMIEFLCSGFAYDVLSSDAEAYRYVPFIMTVAESSFREYKNWYETNRVRSSASDVPIDLFEFLIPAFQHFAAREEGQAMIIGQIEAILAHMDFSWRLVKAEAGESVEGQSGFKLSDCGRSSLSLLVKITELMTDTILVKPEVIRGVPEFVALFDKLVDMMPILESHSIFNSLLSTASILALVLVKHGVTDVADDDLSKVLSGSVKFLTTYKPKISSTEASVFQVGDNTQFWVNIRELWLLGVHLLGCLVQTRPLVETYIERSSPELLDDIRKHSTEDPPVRNR